MGLDDSIFPNAVWNSVDGTMKRMKGSTSTNDSYSVENEAEPPVNPAANVSTEEEDITVSTSAQMYIGWTY